VSQLSETFVLYDYYKRPVNLYDHISAAEHRALYLHKIIWMTSFYLFQVNLTLEREVDGAWVKIPCVDDLGSCYYPDACNQLVQLFMTMTGLCPPGVHISPCICPLKAVSMTV